MGLRSTDYLIDDSTPEGDLLAPVVNGEPKGRGHDPDQVVKTMHASPSEIKLIPRSEWSARIKELEQTNSLLSNIRGDIPSLDQGQVGYCWAHSTTHVSMMTRAIANQPYIPLSAYSIAATIKQGRDEGGWCGLSAQFARQKGIVSQAIWPQGRRDYKTFDKPETWTDAALHQSTEEYVDLTQQVYDQNLTFDQLMTCLLSRTPCMVDFNWWGHSVCGLDPVEVEAGSFGIRIWNSWSDSWGDRGMGVLRGSKAIPNGALAIRVTKAS